MAAPPPSVCVRMGSQVSSTSQTATLARNVSKWFLATATALLDLPLRAHPARSVTNAKETMQFIFCYT